MRTLPPFNYHHPRSAREAVSLLDELGEGARLIAGGTDLIPLIRDGLLTPKDVVDISFIDELRYVAEDGGVVRIGALTKHSELLRSGLVWERASILAKAVRELGSPQIRNLGTIGGNLCNASPAADTVPPLLVLRARTRVLAPDGERTIPLDDFFTGPKRTVLKPNELLIGIEFSRQPQGSGTAFIKLGRRRAYTLSAVSVAVLLKMEDGICEDARIALGSVAPTPIRARSAEDLLRGSELGDELMDKATDVVKEEVSPITDLRATEQYRREMSKVLTKRAMLEALSSGGG